MVPFWFCRVLASITPVLLTTDLTASKALLAVSTTSPPSAEIRPSLSTLSSTTVPSIRTTWPVTGRSTANRMSSFPAKLRVACSPAPIVTLPKLAVMVPWFSTAGAMSETLPPSVARISPWFKMAESGFSGSWKNV